MKRLHTGLIIFDTIDIICISFSAGSGVALLIRKYRKYKGRRGEDPIITELKEKSPLTMFSENGKPLKLPVIRGGERVKGLSLLIKNKRLAILVRAILYARTKQKQLRLLRLCFFTLNTLLTTTVGLRFAVGGQLDYTHFILIAFPSTVGGLIMGLAIANPLGTVLLPLAVLYTRGLKDIPDPLERCKVICKAAEEFHNKQLTIEMKKLNSLVENTSTALQLPLDKVHLLCVEEKLSLLQRYNLRELIRSEKARKRVQHFSEFIKKFPECDADPKAVYEQIVEKITE
jgi:hypothetical protein